MVKEEINLIHGKVTFNQEQIKAINEMKVVWEKEIKDKWQTNLTNDERIEILFMKVQELEQRLSKQEIETDLYQDISQDLNL